MGTGGGDLPDSPLTAIPPGRRNKAFAEQATGHPLWMPCFILLSFSISFGMFSPTSSHICSQVSKMESAAFFPALKRYPR
jgi:hypothetical protein